MTYVQVGTALPFNNLAVDRTYPSLGKGFSSKPYVDSPLRNRALEIEPSNRQAKRKSVSEFEPANSKGKRNDLTTAISVAVGVLVLGLLVVIVCNAFKKNKVKENCGKGDNKACIESLVGAGKDIAKGIAPVIVACAPGLATPHCATTVAVKFFDEGSQLFNQRGTIQSLA